jgi:hypothetical protein
VGNGKGPSELELTAVGDLGSEAFVARKADEVERRVGVVVLWHAPLDGVLGAGAPEELGEGLHLRPPVVQEPVVEHAQVPHLSCAISLLPLLLRRGEQSGSRGWLHRRWWRRRPEGIEEEEKDCEKGKKPT